MRQTTDVDVAAIIQRLYRPDLSKDEIRDFLKISPPSAPKEIEKTCSECGSTFKTYRPHYFLCKKCYKLKDAGLELSWKTKTGEIDQVGGIVYILKDSDSGLVKIGTAGDVDRRIKQIRYKTPNAILIAKFPYQMGHNCERELHVMFDRKRQRLESSDAPTEWFSMTDEDISYILSSYLSYKL